MVDEAFAKRHQIQVLADSILATGGAKWRYAKLGIIKTLHVGSIEYRNMPVYITDHILPQQARDSLGYDVSATIGIDFMKAAGKIVVYPQKHLFEFPMPDSFSLANIDPAANLMIVNNYPYIAASLENVHSLLLVDTGAAQELSIKKGFYQAHKNYFSFGLTNKTTKRWGGYDGVSYITTYKIPDLPLQIGKQKRDLKEAVVQDDDNLPYNGCVGRYFFNKQKKVIFDFNKMQLHIE
jgi:hypothetical protein